MESSSSIRLVLAEPISFGPGKAELLKKIEETGSLLGSAAAMGMSYNKAWKMIHRLNTMFLEPLVVLHRGGKNQGGAELTVLGREVLTIYEEAVASAEVAAADAMQRLSALLAGNDAQSSKS